MIRVEHIAVNGFEAAIRGMRNPLESWNRSDSVFNADGSYSIGEADLELMQKLCRAGSDHRKFMRMINVSMDITAPAYWAMEHDTYKVATVRNSCSLQHKGASKEFAFKDFSIDEKFYDTLDPLTNAWEKVIECINILRALYNDTNDYNYFLAMRSLLPMGYIYRYTWAANYEVCYNIYKSRKEHKISEWREFCRILLDELPYFAEIIGERKEND